MENLIMKETADCMTTTNIRIPAEVKSFLKREAKRLDRSMNYIIVSILKEAMNNANHK